MHSRWLNAVILSAGCADRGLPLNTVSDASGGDFSSPTLPADDFRTVKPHEVRVNGTALGQSMSVALELRWFPPGESKLSRVSAVHITARPSGKTHLVMEWVTPGGVIFQRYEGDAAADAPVRGELLVSGTQVEQRQLSGQWVVNATDGEVNVSTSFELEP